MTYNTKYLSSIMPIGSAVGGQMWVYDTEDAVSSVYAVGYISDAKTKGMLKGDIVFVRKWTTAPPVATSELQAADGAGNDLLAITIHFVIGINATTGAADLTDGLAITATNT